MGRGKPLDEADLTWRARVASLANVGRLAAMLWATSPPLLLAGTLLRLSRAVLPLALLWIPKLILDGVNALSRGHGNVGRLWRLVLLEMALALIGELLLRANNLADGLLGDRFVNHLAIRVMDHASLLDLASFEDPVFYDKLERVRSQANGRTVMLTSLFGLLQDLVSIDSPGFRAQRCFAVAAGASGSFPPYLCSSARHAFRQ